MAVRLPPSILDLLEVSNVPVSLDQFENLEDTGDICIDDACGCDSIEYVSC
jgi:hypothetical protein